MRTVVRNFPSNMREMGDLAKLAYLNPRIRRQWQAHQEKDRRVPTSIWPELD
jgi:hypothetical protein